MVFERDVTQALVKWINTEKALLLRGPRQVGKTFILKYLGENHFKQTLYIDFNIIAAKEWFDSRSAAIFDGISWINAFAEFAEITGQPFNNAKETLVILDEIQAAAPVFNGIRGMVRECDFRIAATGSYLGIIDLENYASSNGSKYAYSAGDMICIDMHTMTYAEVIRASFSVGKNDLGAISEFYMRFVGFPEVVERWLRKDDPHSCTAVLENIYDIFVRESNRYFVGPLPEKIWTDTLISVVAQIESKKAVPISEELTLKFRLTPGLDVRRQETIDSIYWLISSRLLFLGEVTNNLKTLKRSKYNYYFEDQGLMFLIMAKALRNDPSVIDRGNMLGLLAENFVALAIREFRQPKTYSRVKPDEEIDFIMKDAGMLTGIEVKVTSGPVISSEKALECGDIARLIKIQGHVESNTHNTVVMPLSHVHELGQLFGYPANLTKYNQEYDYLGYNAVDHGQ